MVLDACKSMVHFYLAQDTVVSRMCANFSTWLAYQQIDLFWPQTLQFPPSCASLGRLTNLYEGIGKAVDTTLILSSLTNSLTTVQARSHHSVLTHLVQ